MRSMKEPKIRFKGFKGEWEEKLLGKVAPLKGGYAFLSSNFKKTGIPIVRISNILETGIVGGDFVFYNKFDGDKQFILSSGDMVVAMSGATTGKVASIQGNGIFYQNQRYGKFSKTDIVDYSFLSALVGSNKFTIALNTLLAASAQPNASAKDINSIKFAFPKDKIEQEILGIYIYHINNLISSSMFQLASLKQIKAASLQSMFPQKGETKPRVRFKGFEEEWMTEKLGSLFIERNESNIYGEMLSVTMNNGIIKAADNGRFDNSNKDKSHYKVVKIGDIAYNSMRMWQGASGCSPYDGIVSPAYTVIIPRNGINSLFFAYHFKTIETIKKFRLNSQGLTTDTWNLKYPAFSLIEVLYPSSLDEQQKIASYFLNLDRQITLQTRRLEKLKQIKAACLDKMFV